jgi:SAM-dependent methyltransferase
MKLIEHTYGLKTDLDKPEFKALKRDLETLNKGHLAWSRQWEYPWVLLQAGELKEDMVILDAGAGHSCLQKYLCKKVKKVFNVDIDPAVTTHEKEFPNLTAVVADIRKMPFAENSFDAVYCISVLEHVGDDPMESFNECMRVLKPGGHFYLTVDVSIEPSPYDFSLPKFHKFCELLGIGIPALPADALKSREFDFDTHVDQLAVYAYVIEK